MNATNKFGVNLRMERGEDDDEGMGGVKEGEWMEEMQVAKPPPVSFFFHNMHGFMSNQFI